MSLIYGCIILESKLSLTQSHGWFVVKSADGDKILLTIIWLVATVNFPPFVPGYVTDSQ